MISALLFIVPTLHHTATQQQQDLFEETLNLLSDILSWPWPKPHEGGAVTKTGVSTDLLEPDVSFEPIFIRNDLLEALQEMYVMTWFE